MPCSGLTLSQISCENSYHHPAVSLLCSDAAHESQDVGKTSLPSMFTNEAAQRQAFVSTKPRRSTLIKYGCPLR